MTNALLIYPEYPPSYWSLQYGLEFWGKKALTPPLGLLTIAALFPDNYALRVVDVNVAPLEDADLRWADLAFTSTMVVQRGSLQTVIEQCNQAGVPVVAGGPHPTTFHADISGVQHFILGEAEEIFPVFLRDLENGAAKPIYRESRKPYVSCTPIPRFDLITPNDYQMMNVQFSRGCPFNCEFCDITKLYGRVPRTKSPEQVVAELDVLYQLGWRGLVFIVDDNFIGNKRDAMRLLPAITEWQQAHNYPFSLLTEATVNLAGMDKLMDRMVEAGFESVFLGIETPTPKALIKTKKPQNVNKNQEDDFLLKAVRKIQQKGMQVTGGFILGLDGDDETMFDSQIEFIQQAGIAMASVGLLTAIKNTDLYDRMERENRLLDQAESARVQSVVNLMGVNLSINFRPEMDIDVLNEGYRRVICTLYDENLENFYKRCLTLFKYLEPGPRRRSRVVAETGLAHVMMALRKRLSPVQLRNHTQFIATVSKDYPLMLPEAIDLCVMGYHVARLIKQQLTLNDFRDSLLTELENFKEMTLRKTDDEEALSKQRDALLFRSRQRYLSLPRDFRHSGDGVDIAYDAFRSNINRPAAELMSLPTG